VGGSATISPVMSWIKKDDTIRGGGGWGNRAAFKGAKTQVEGRRRSVWDRVFVRQEGGEKKRGAGPVKKR